MGTAEQERPLLLSATAEEGRITCRDTPHSHKRRKRGHRRKKGFGVRDHLDHFYNEEVDEWSADGIILENQTAFRRRLFRVPAWKGIAYTG